MSKLGIFIFCHITIASISFGQTKTYHLMDDLVDFHSGIYLCDTDGQDLATIKTVDELNEVKAYLASIGLATDTLTDIWVGLKYNELSGEFQWIDGDQFTLNNFWYSGEPNCYIIPCGSDLEHCVRANVLTGGNIFFRTKACSVRFKVLCSERVPTTTALQTTNDQSTALETTPVLPTVSLSLQCQCPCSKVGTTWIDKILSNITSMDLRQIVLEDFDKRIKPEITVLKTSLSKTIRAKTSIYENRVVPKSFGWLSISVLSVLFVLIIAIDCMNFCMRK